ncbi:hypothetical protein V6N13_108981 [Hibiscus sabdariffa]
MTMEKYMKKNISYIHDDIMKLDIKNKEALENLPLLPLPQGFTTAYYGICGAGESVGDSERIVTTSMAWNNWFHNIMNPNEFKGGDSSTNVGSYIDLTHYNPYVEPGSSSVAHCTVLEGSSIGDSSSVVA